MLQAYGNGMIHSPDPVVVAVCGDQIVGQALVLLLHDPAYAIRFLPASTLTDPGALDDLRLLLLTSTPRQSSERRDSLVKSLKRGMVADIPILQLVTSSETQTVRVGSDHTVSWPCSIGELKRRINEALGVRHGTHSTAGRTPLAQTGQGYS